LPALPGQFAGAPARKLARPQCLKLARRIQRRRKFCDCASAKRIVQINTHQCRKSPGVGNLAVIGRPVAIGYHRGGVASDLLRLGDQRTGDLTVAKRKSTVSSKRKSSASAQQRSFGADNGESSSASKKAAAPAQPAFSPHEIGNAAGDIWGLLSNNGEQTLAALKKSVDAPPDIVMAAIGWLAREDKLEFATSGRTVKISLR
jgi:hypothetical protein